MDMHARDLGAMINTIAPRTNDLERIERLSLEGSELKRLRSAGPWVRSGGAARAPLLRTALAGPLRGGGAQYNTTLPCSPRCPTPCKWTVGSSGLTMPLYYLSD